MSWPVMRLPRASVEFRLPKAALSSDLASFLSGHRRSVFLSPPPPQPYTCSFMQSTVLPHNRCDCFPLRCHGNAHCHLGGGAVAAETSEWPIRLSRKVFSVIHCSLPTVEAGWNRGWCRRALLMGTVLAALPVKLRNRQRDTWC